MFIFQGEDIFNHKIFLSVFEVVSKFAVPANEFYDHQKSSAVSHPK